MTESYTFWLTVAVGLGALALVVQAICLLGTYKAVRDMQERFYALMPKIETTLSHAEKTFNESRQEIHQATAKAGEVFARSSEVLALAQAQLAKVDGVVAKANGAVIQVTSVVTKVDGFVDETASRARTQMDNIEGVLDHSLNRVKHTVGMVNDTVSWPVRELNALASGVKAAAGALFGKRGETTTEQEHPTNNHQPVGL